jgi:hypothetical protein
VRLFKRRFTTEELLRGHLKRLGVSAAWLPSARDAIRCCEERDYFQPVFSVAGPAPARSVIALMRLEPFVRGEIDWSVSPSESPFWVGSAGDLDDEPFTETSQRFVDLYWLGGSPSLGHDFEAALCTMVAVVEESLATGRRRELDAEARRGLCALGSAGYLWRVAESTTQTSDLNLRADLVKEVEAVIDSFPEEEASRDRLIPWAAAECVRRNLLFGSGSPGGWAAGSEFLRRGFRFADRHVVPEGTAVPRKERWYAFVFGVALYDIDECLARRPATPGNRRPLAVYDSAL